MDSAALDAFVEAEARKGLSDACKTVRLTLLQALLLHLACTPTCDTSFSRAH